MTQRSILVTGCSSGIGAYCIERLRDDGWRVFATARQQEDIARLKSDGFEAFYLDYREPSSIDACFEAVLKSCGGRLDALFNNGAYAQPGAVEDVPTQALREQFEANFFGLHHLTLLALKAMRAQGYGRIIQHSSVLGLVPMPLRGAYNASKFAIEGLYSTMYQELKGSNIHISLMETGPIPSKIASNGLPYIEKYIDVENSLYRALYEPRIAQMKAGGTPDPSGKGAEPVYVQLRRALNAKNPKPHYYNTIMTHIAALMRRFLPAKWLYRILGSWS